jgi:hypothetical protein
MSDVYGAVEKSELMNRPSSKMSRSYGMSDPIKVRKKENFNITGTSLVPSWIGNEWSDVRKPLHSDKHPLRTTLSGHSKHVCEGDCQLDRPQPVLLYAGKIAIFNTQILTAKKNAKSHKLAKACGEFWRKI